MSRTEHTLEAALDWDDQHPSPHNLHSFGTAKHRTHGIGFRVLPRRPDAPEKSHDFADTNIIDLFRTSLSLPLKGEFTMPILNKLTGAFPTALIYITIGTLITIWTLVYWILSSTASQTGHFWVVGFFLTGLSLLAIGLLLGKIGRSARAAELPPVEVTPAAVHADIVAPRQVVHAAPAAPAVSGLPSVPVNAAAVPVSTLPSVDPASRITTT